EVISAKMTLFALKTGTAESKRDGCVDQENGMERLTCFKAYDIRGELGRELNEDVAYRIGRAYGQHFRPQAVAVGGDVRLSSPSLKMALAQGLMDAGADVIDLGLTGTEEVYFAAQSLHVDGI